MTTMTREEMIDKLVENDTDNFDIRDLANLFRYGMTGYETCQTKN
jgi:hypothetical protein